MALAEVGLTPGWATFGQVLPQGAAHDHLQVGTLDTQTDVKTRWPDGSIKFAVLTTQVPETGTYPIMQGSPSASGTIAVEDGLHSVVLVAADGVNWRALSAGTPQSRWLDGPLVVETRRVVTPVNYLGQPHPFLRVVFDERWYRDGQFRLDATVENTRHAAGEEIVYAPMLFYNDTPVWSWGQVRHPYLTRWRVVVEFWDFATVTPDFAPAVAAKAVPSYWSGVVNTVSTFDLYSPEFAVLGRGDLNPFMPDHGGRPEIAPYPDWAVRYLVHRDPDQQKFVLKHGDLAGSWPVHVREDDFSFLTVDNRPNYWLDPRAESQDRPQGDLTQRGLLVPDIAHQPSLAYIPYLITGDRYHAEEMAAWANYTLLATFQDPFYQARGGAQGLLHSNEVRGVGWGLRNLADAAAYLPDNNPLKPYFAEKVRNNLTWLDQNARDTVNPLGVLWVCRRAECFDPLYWDRAWISTWEQNYVAWAIDHANKQGFAGGLEHRNRIVDFQLRLFRPDIRDGCAPYICPVGVRTEPENPFSPINFYTDVGQTFQGSVELLGYYGVDARLACVIGLESGHSLATDAYAYLDSILKEQDAGGGVPDLGRRAGWAILPV